MEKKGAQKEMKEEREGKMPNPYRLSHFVAPLYVAPSPTPGNAKPTSEFWWSRKSAFRNFLWIWEELDNF